MKEVQGNYWTGDSTSLASLNKPFWVEVTGVDGSGEFYAWTESEPFPTATFNQPDGLRDGTVLRNPLYIANSFPITIGSYVLIRRAYLDEYLDWVYVVVEYASPYQTFTNITVEGSLVVGGVNITVSGGTTYFTSNTTVITVNNGGTVWGDPLSTNLVTRVCYTAYTGQEILTSEGSIEISSGTPVDILELEFTLEDERQGVLIDGAIDWVGADNVGDIFNGTMLLDGVEIGGLTPYSERMICFVPIVDWQASTSWPWSAFPGAGTHTLKLQALRQAGSGIIRVYSAKIRVHADGWLVAETSLFSLPNGAKKVGQLCVGNPTDCCPEDPGPPSGGGDCASSCGGCSMPFTVSVAISGVTNGSCGDCTDLNGTYILTWVSSYPLSTEDWCAQWVGTVAEAGCGSGYDIVLYYSISEAKWKLQYPRGASPSTTLTFVGDWDCVGDNVFTDSSTNTYCPGPVTLTVTVAECGEGGPCAGHPTCVFCTGIAPTSWALTLAGFEGGAVDVNGDWVLTQATPGQTDLPFGCGWCQTKTIEGPDGNDQSVEVCLMPDVGPDGAGALILVINNDAYYALLFGEPIDCCADATLDLTLVGTYDDAPLTITAVPTCDTCGTVATDCCPDDDLPEQLYATLTGTGSCACMDGTYPIFYSATGGPLGGPAWVYTGETCGDNTLNIVMDCTVDPVWRLKVQCGMAEPTFSVDVLDCNPFSASFTGYTFAGGCCTGDVEAVVTETAP